jgi:SAM-dependent methyltransferase
MDETSERIRSYFDRVGDVEWERLSSSWRGRINLEVHRRMAAAFVHPGDRVLEIGAGGGRLTIELAALGALVVVTDVSPVQLELNARHVAEAGYAPCIEDRFLLDVRDTERFADDAFDVVVAYGGPLSYVFEDADEALGGLLRIGDRVLASVMSTLGSWRFFLPSIIDQVDTLGLDATDAIIETGDLRLEQGLSPHFCQMYRWSEVSALVERCGGTLLAASASNCASMTDEEQLERIGTDPEHWRRFVEHEIRACREPGALDGGSHIVFACTMAAGSP